MPNPVNPKKKLGQHFLVDQNIARNIASSLQCSQTNAVLEVGPGMGMLTRFLLERPEIDLMAVEVDAEALSYLSIQFPELPGRLIFGDFLRLKLDSLYPSGFNLIGNFPYNISSQIFFKVLDNRHLIPEVVGMIQKEVAVRLATPPGNREAGILSVLLQTWYDIELLFTVHEHVFHPPPKVKSAVVRLVRKNSPPILANEGLYFRLVKMAFNQRRKTLGNALKAMPGLRELSGAPTRFFPLRAEQLSLDDFVELCQALHALGVELPDSPNKET